MSRLNYCPRIRPAAHALTVVVCALLLLACGGGTEVSPSEPAPPGPGTGAATLDGVDLGPTELVDSLVSSVLSVNRTVVDESVTIGADGWAAVQNGSVALGGEQITDLAGTTLYSRSTASCDRDYEWYTSGAFQACPGAGMAPGQTVLVDYQYSARLPSIRVGLTFALGTQIELDIFNLDPAGSGPVTLNQVASTNPGAGSSAFFVRVATDLTLPTGQGSHEAVPECSIPGATDCAVLNELQIDSYSLVNELNPCIAGHATLVVQDLVDPNNRRVVLTVDFSDSDC